MDIIERSNDKAVLMMKSEELLIGWAVEDITPHGPVVLFGQYYDRHSQYVESALTVTACDSLRPASTMPGRSHILGSSGV